MTSTPRRARWSIAVVFLTNGFLVGSWAPNVPLIRDRLGLSDGSLSVALLAMAVGAVFGMPIAGYLVSRFGSAGPARVAMVLMTLSLPLIALMPTLATLSLSTFVFGALNGICDIAMNAHAVEVERRYGRPIMSGLHATWSIGGFAASAAGGVVLLHVGSFSHFTGVAVVFLIVGLLAFRGLLPGSVDRGEAGSHFVLPNRAVVLVGLLTLGSFLTEGAMTDWNAIFMRTTYGTDATLTAAGYAAFAGGMAIGRFSGDFIRMRIRAVTIVRWSGAIAAVGLAAAALAGNAYVSIAAFAVAGLGIANLVPLFFVAAGRATPESPGRGVSGAATCGYFGFLAGPPAIGFVSEHVGLAPVFVALALILALIAMLAAAVRPADHQTNE